MTEAADGDQTKGRGSLVVLNLRSYVRTLWWRMAAGILASIFACPPAKAQSLFETLFGFGVAKPAAERSARPKIRSGSRMGTKPQSYSTWAAERFQSTPADGDDYVRDPAFGGSYRTVCVRTCDGYYWPISHSVTRDGFASDARQCESSCAGEAKLYFQSRHDPDPKSMVDLEGKPYTELKTAFLYRRTLTAGCGCRPAPWSVAERFRHHEYRVADDARKLQVAMQRERDRAEALRQDKIAQIIAATRAATELDAAEDATFGEAIASVEIDTDPEVSVTGYVHLHVLPSDAVLAVEEDVASGGDTEPAVNLSDLEVAFAEIQAVAPVKPASRDAKPRKSRSRTVRAKTAKPVQTVSLFGGLSSLIWPGDAPASKH